jgi:hypothetical protein
MDRQHFAVNQAAGGIRKRVKTLGFLGFTY